MNGTAPEDVWLDETAEPSNDFTYTRVDAECLNYPDVPKEVLNSIFPYDGEFVKKMLHNQHILFIGDSLTRGIYKDLLAIIVNDNLSEESDLKNKAEPTCLNDRMIDILPLENDRVFRQAREYQSENHLIQYMFSTRVMKTDLEKTLMQLFIAEIGDSVPDIIVMNSMIWDMSRYTALARLVGSNVTDAQREQFIMEDFLERLAIVMRRLRLYLPPTTMVIWLDLPWPTKQNSETGFLSRPTINPNSNDHLRCTYQEGNYRAAQVVREAGFDVLDIGFYFRNHLLMPFKVKDGVHWDRFGTRIMTQLLIGHVARSMGLELPERVQERLDQFREEIVGVQAQDETSVNIVEFISTVDQDSEGEVGSFAERKQRELTEAVFNDIEAENKENAEAISQAITIMRAVTEMLPRSPDEVGLTDAGMEALQSLINESQTKIRGVWEGREQVIEIARGRKRRHEECPDSPNNQPDGFDEADVPSQSDSPVEPELPGTTPDSSSVEEVPSEIPNAPIDFTDTFAVDDDIAEIPSDEL